MNCQAYGHTTPQECMAEQGWHPCTLEAALFDAVAAETEWVVRHATTGHTFYTGSELDCEAWVTLNPTVKWVVVEQANAAPKSLDEYLRAGMMRNYPGERKTRYSGQLALI